MPQKFTNQGKAALAGSITAVATSLTVSASLADLFPVANTANWAAPADWFKALIVDNTGQVEVIKVGTRTAGSGVFSVLLRGQDGTTAKAFTAGSAYVVHGPVASDFQNALAGIFPYVGAIDGADPKLEVSKTGAGAAAAMFHMVAGKLTLAQSDGVGGVTADRFTLDQTNGTLTCTDVSITSDERLKTGWKGLGRFFVARLADVKAGTYLRKGSKRRETGVSAQALREVLPQAVAQAPDGTLSVSYGQAALVAAIELARDVVQLRAELADLAARVKRLDR